MLHKESDDRYLKHSHPLLLTKRHLANSRVKSPNQNNDRVKKIYFDEKVPLKLNCSFPDEHRNTFNNW
ncbi:hypothetical protein ACTXT7_001478 [Hymenolepis weldensis]